MNKNLTPKAAVIVVLVIIAAWTLYPPDKSLKPGIDLAGGTSLIYEIDTTGLNQEEERGLAQRMITVLRRRIDPANIQNLIWRPQGNTRFEIQMPLASAEAREKRQSYRAALDNLLGKNINPAKIMRSLQQPPQERVVDFNDFAQDDPNRLSILQNLADTYDKRVELQNKRDTLFEAIEATEEKIASAAGLDLELIKLRRAGWTKLNDQELQESLKEFLGSEDNVDLLIEHVKTYAEQAQVLDQLTAESGVNAQYQQAKRELDRLNLTEDQIDFVLEMSPKSADRARRIEQLKIEFADRAADIDNAVAAYDEYRPFRGRLDDPADLQRMLKGAGILEFRILPTTDRAELSPDEIDAYVKSLTDKGPKYASDNKYVWCEIENIKEWAVPNGIVAPFGDKFYVLASNRQDEVMLHSTTERTWALENAQPSTDRMGRRAIGFLLDEKGGWLIAKVSSKNIERPMCILLDGIAISAPNISTRLGRNSQITGSFSQTQVTDMVNKLNAGSLPARLVEQPISVKTIGPSIGADNRDQGIKAGLIGLVAVVACVLLYYTLAGSIADVALLMNILFVLAIMAGVRATFTLPGIAGIILTIGMSVDANVLIFERIREEQQKGSALSVAIKNGYQRAFRTILDANLTTFITAAILYWVASEEIKGFAIVLMLGIVSSMFTALFVTRVIFDFLLGRRIIRDHLVMLRLIHQPNVNWMALRPVFLGISVLLIVAGLFVFFTRDNTENNKYDIEFTGGTSVQINLKEGVSLTRQQVEDKIRSEGDPPALAAANVYSVGTSGRQYEITTTETNKTTATITFPDAEPASSHTVKTVTRAVRSAEARSRGRLSNLRVDKAEQSSDVFVVTTSQANRSLVQSILRTAFPQASISEPQVDEVVNDTIRAAFADELEIQQDLQPSIAATEVVSEELIDSYPELADFVGGVKIECEIERAATPEELDRRLRDLRFKPDMMDFSWYPYRLLGKSLTPMDPNLPVNSFTYVSVDPEAPLRQASEDERTRFIENENARVLAAGRLEASLPRVTQIDPSVGSKQRERALVAIVLSLSAIVAYIWIRFGDVRYGLAAIVALVHDVCITLGAVTACTYLASMAIGETLLIGDFKINLAMIAAFLTLIGYSLNDTIVVFDRIRENRHKAQLTPQTITNSINQTISRTILTSFTTFIVVLIMYIFGGQNLRGFTFAIGFGVIIGTYSSIAIAAPVLLLRPIHRISRVLGAEKRTEKRK
ncbi:MAG: protein translocase subunit SecD [Phycisphaerales bacterium]|nr:MAG: protein translocase subunit SecD [Phycisphaerales bacterium]